MIHTNKTKHGSGNKPKYNPNIPTWNQGRVSALPVVMTDVYAYDIPELSTDDKRETPKRFIIRKDSRKRFEIVDTQGDYVYETHKHYQNAKNACQLLNNNANKIRSRA